MFEELQVFVDQPLSGGYPSEPTGYRPPQWGAPPDEEQQVYVRTNMAGYFFDAVIREEHVSTLRITEHPVQNGASITDHAYQVPSRLTLEIGMSDVMDTYIPGQYEGGYDGKSVYAYQTFKALQMERVPFTVVTRLDVYENMLIEQIVSPVDNTTPYGLKCIIMLRQIIMAKVSDTTVKSESPQTTDKTDTGQSQTKQPDDGSVASQMEDKFDDWTGSGGRMGVGDEDTGEGGGRLGVGE